MRKIFFINYRREKASLQNPQTPRECSMKMAVRNSRNKKGGISTELTDLRVWGVGCGVHSQRKMVTHRNKREAINSEITDILGVPHAQNSTAEPTH